MISCGADKSIYFRTAQKVIPLEYPFFFGNFLSTAILRLKVKAKALDDSYRALALFNFAAL